MSNLLTCCEGGFIRLLRKNWLFTVRSILKISRNKIRMSKQKISVNRENRTITIPNMSCARVSTIFNTVSARLSAIVYYNEVFWMKNRMVSLPYREYEYRLGHQISSTSLVHRPSPMLILKTDRLVGLAAGFLALALAIANAFSASISDTSGASSWFLNNASDLNCKLSCSSSNPLKVCSSNILYDKRLAFLLKIGWRRWLTLRTLSSIGLPRRFNMWAKYFSGTWWQSIWHHFAVEKWKAVLASATEL